MIIRKVEKSDINEWAKLRNNLWPDSIESHEKELKEFFAGNSIDIVETFVLEAQDKKLAGFIELNIRNFAEGSRESEVPYIEFWYVSPNFQNMGNGNLLIQAAESWAKEKGYSELASDTDITNEKSIKIHKRLGFKETDRVVCFLKKL